MKKTEYDTDLYEPNLHNILVQTTNLSLYTELTKKSMVEVLRVRKLPSSFFELKINRIQNLKPDVAKLLQHSHFDTVELKGVKKIEDKALSYLAKSSALLDLGLTKLNVAQASILVKYHRAALVFSGLQSISLPVVKILSMYKGNVLELAAIKSISPASIDFLDQQYAGGFLTIGPNLTDKIITTKINKNDKQFNHSRTSSNNSKI